MKFDDWLKQSKPIGGWDREVIDAAESAWNAATEEAAKAAFALMHKLNTDYRYEIIGAILANKEPDR